MTVKRLDDLKELREMAAEAEKSEKAYQMLDEYAASLIDSGVNIHSVVHYLDIIKTALMIEIVSADYEEIE